MSNRKEDERKKKKNVNNNEYLIRNICNHSNVY